MGCSPGDDAQLPGPSTEPPAITSAAVTCTPEHARWRFQVTTDAWTGNGQVLLSADGIYVERHPIFSQSAAPDGTSDTLDLTLSVQPDWRDVNPGSSTVFNCREPDLAGILRVFTRDGAAEADCRAFGIAPERWVDWTPGTSCAVILETILETD